MAKSTLAKLLCVFLLSVAFISCSEIKDKKVLYFAHSLPITHPVHTGILDFQRILDEKSGGKLQIKIFPDGQLGSEREALELLQIGSVAMTKVSAASMSSFAPEYQVLTIPYIFRDSTHLFKVLEGNIGKEILAGGSEFLLRGLCYYDAGSRSFYAREKPIEAPSDLKGMKIRVMNDKLAVDMVGVLGGSATPMAYGELYTALQQKVVDGAENNIPSFVTSNHYEICKYYTFDEHTMVPDVVVIGTKFWESLSDIEKEWVQAAANESVTAEKIAWRKTVAENMEVLKAANVEFYYPDKKQFSDKTDALTQELMKNPKLKSIIEQIQTVK